MAKDRKQTWINVIVGCVGLILVAIPGMHYYVKATATVLHPNPQASPSVTYSAPTPDWHDAVEQGRQIVRAGLKEQNLPGLSVAVGVNGDLVWTEGFGWADLEKRTKVSPETLFRIGTASTVLTSAGAGLLVERGALKLDDPIQKYVPAFSNKQVTVRQVMAHMAGVRSDSGDEGPLLGRDCEKFTEGLEEFADRSLLFEPGTEYRFSNYGYILVSAAIEAATNEPFLSFMRKHVFAPLGMDQTRSDSMTDPVPERATFYFPRYGSDPRYGLHLMRDVFYSCYAGSSVFLSTPSDMVRFGMALNAGKLLQPATVQMMQASQRLPSGEETGYGLGWDVENVTLLGRQTRVIGHDGETLGGMVTSLMSFPEHGIVLAVASNISYADTFSLGTKIAEAFAKKAERPAGK